jgi:BIM1-like copper acquisition factor
MATRLWLALRVAAALGTISAPGWAHINLQSPPARAPGRPDTFLTRAPCGQLDDARDPAKVSTFEPGQTIVVEWEVYQQHVSYFRVAVDLDGDDSFSERTSQPADALTDDLTQLRPNPGERILAYVEDDAGEVDHVAEAVTLPDEECDRCTLQLIQFTYGLPLYQAYYYQCADIVLRRSAAPGGAGAGDAGTGGAEARGEDEPPAEASGCALAGAPRGVLPATGSAALAASAVALALVGLARRRAGRHVRRARHIGL